MLYYSSAFFGTVAIHASMYHTNWMCPAFICMLYLSSINHMGKTVDFYGKHIINLMDRGLAHAIAGATLYDAMSLSLTQNVVLYYTCLAYTVLAYHLGLCGKNKKYHASIHLSSCLGSHILMMEYHKQHALSTLH